MHTNVKYHRSWVGIDDYLGPFPALVADQHWNGWAMPKFDRPTAEEVVRAVNNGPGDATLTWDGDVIIYHTPEYADDPGYEDERITPDRDGLYGIGWGSWVWDESVPDFEVAVAALVYSAEGDHAHGLLDEPTYGAIYELCDRVLSEDFAEWSAQEHSRFAPDDFLRLGRNRDQLIELILEYRRR